MWNAQTGEDLIVRVQHRTSGPLAWSADSKYVASGKQNGVDFWNSAQKRIILNYAPVSQYPVTALAWSPDMRVLATDVKHPRIGVWKVEISQAPSQDTPQYTYP